MAVAMYNAIQDPYCYEGTTVLKNLRNFRTQRELEEFEVVATSARADEELPDGVLDATHYRAVHRHLFQDVYPWAGEYRTIRIHKNNHSFCYPEHIDHQMENLFAELKKKHFLFDLMKVDFVKEAAAFLTTLNAIHPFREGNGRTQMTFVVLLADRAGHTLNLEKLDPRVFLAAMIASFDGNTAPLKEQFVLLTK